MARFYLHESAAETGMKSGQDPDASNKVQRPAMFGGGSIDLKVGGVAFSLVGYDFYHVGPGEYVDLPDSVPTKIIRDIAPQLMTKSEAVAKGMAAEDGSLLKKKPADEDAGKRKKE